MVQCQIEKAIVPGQPHQHKTYTYYKIMFWRWAKWRSWWMGPVEANGKYLQPKSKIVVCRTIFRFFHQKKSFLTLNETFLTCLIFLISFSVDFVEYTRNFFLSSIEFFMNTSFNNDITIKVRTDKIRIIARKKWSYLPKFRGTPGGRVLQFWHRLHFQ